MLLAIRETTSLLRLQCSRMPLRIYYPKALITLPRRVSADETWKYAYGMLQSATEPMSKAERQPRLRWTR